MVYAPREITHGTHEVYYSALNGGTGVTAATGVTKFAPSSDQSQKAIYADAQTHMVLTSPQTLKIEQEQYQRTADERQQSGELLANGGFTDGGGYPTFDVQRLLTVTHADGTTTDKLQAFYGVTATAYKESDDEDTDEISAKTYTRTLSVAGKSFAANNGKTIKQFEVERTAQNAAIFDTYKTKILTPDAFKAS